MDIRAFLAEQGLGEEEIAAIVGNEKQAKAMSAALAKFEEGNTALTSAKTEREEATKFWEEKVTPALASVDKRVASAEADKARYAAYLKSLKESGYDVPDDLVAGAKVDPPQPQFVTREQMGKEFAATGPTLISLTQLSNEYSDLYGTPYLSMEQDFTDSQKARKNFREYVRDKYKFTEKRADRDKASEQKRIDAIVAEQMKTKEAELAAKYGSNPDLRAAMPSKFDKIEKMAEHKDSWKTNAGREASRKSRLGRFENVTLQ